MLGPCSNTDPQVALLAIRFMMPRRRIPISCVLCLCPVHVSLTSCIMCLGLSAMPVWCPSCIIHLPAAVPVG
jgi:hypothetical protein